MTTANISVIGRENRDRENVNWGQQKRQWTTKSRTEIKGRNSCNETAEENG